MSSAAGLPTVTFTTGPSFNHLTELSTVIAYSSTMKRKTFAVLVASVGLLTYVASAQTTKTPCDNCTGGDIKCCGTVSGETYFGYPYR